MLNTSSASAQKQFSPTLPLPASADGEWGGRAVWAGIISGCSVQPPGIGASFIVLLLSEPGTEQRDGVATELLAMVFTEASGQPAHTESQWHLVVKPCTGAFIFILVYLGKIERHCHSHACIETHLLKLEIHTVWCWRGWKRNNHVWAKPDGCPSTGEDFNLNAVFTARFKMFMSLPVSLQPAIMTKRLLIQF